MGEKFFLRISGNTDNFHAEISTQDRKIVTKGWPLITCRRGLTAPKSSILSKNSRQNIAVSYGNDGLVFVFIQKFGGVSTYLLPKSGLVYPNEFWYLEIFGRTYVSLRIKLHKNNNLK
jgi:hypothetical protein